MATTKTTAKKTTTTAKPAAKKTVTATTTKTTKPASSKPATTAAKPQSKPAASKPAAARAKPAPRKGNGLTPEQHYKMIQDAAYFMAEKNGFAGGAMDYWIAAEAQIEMQLSGK